MKANYLLSLFVLVTPLAAQDERKPVEKMPVADAKAMSPNQQAFLNLPEESRKEFMKHLSEATRLFQQKRIFECLDELDKTEQIFPDSPEIYNLRGSCFVEMRAFDKALVQFEKARSYTKDNASVDFNVAEIYFVTKEWKKCLTMLERILTELDLLEKQLKEASEKNPALYYQNKALIAQNTALSRLAEFKILLCEKKLGMNAEAAILADKYDFLDDSPYYYFAQAALAYDKKDLVKAEEWLGVAGRIFQDPNVLAPWQDTMVEYGYIKSFYGDDAAADQ